MSVLLPIFFVPNALSSLSVPFSSLSRRTPNPNSLSFPITLSPNPKPYVHIAASDSSQNPNPKSPNRRVRRSKSKDPPKPTAGDVFPSTIPRQPRRGRRSESAAVEDFVRDSIERTLASIRRQNAGLIEAKDQVLRPRAEEGSDGPDRPEEVVEEDDPDWPADAEVGWGVRASEYFDKYPIKNVVVGGVEIDWEGEMEEGLVKEINCLEWESFAFHPSPLIVLVFERYNRAPDNWKILKELEKAANVYWNAKDKLPPRTVKIDINIERDLAYALKVKECPQLLFLRGSKILYREKEIRTADELVHMIAHFYYNAKRPSWIDVTAVAPPF